MNNWLFDAGLVLKLGRVEKPTLPLNAYADMDVFKLFLLGIGLLNALTRLDSKILLEKNSILTEFKGVLTEQIRRATIENQPRPLLLEGFERHG